MPSHANQQTTMEPEDLHTPENINDLARVIASEARGLSETAQTMVGWTVVNRMKKHNLKRVSEVWANSQYVHGHFLTPTSLRLADSILGGTAMDISQGATHFYTPGTMPKTGEPHSGIDIGGGLESTPGVYKNGKPVQNYRPRWTTRFSAVRTPSIQEKDFRFYREP
jgi:hypothetical protein